MDENGAEMVGRFRVRGRGVLIDSGVLADTGVFIDSPEVRRVPILLLDWPVPIPSETDEPLEMIWLQADASLRDADAESGGTSASILARHKPHPARRIGTEQATGLPLYQFVRSPYVIPEPEYARPADNYDRDRGEVDTTAVFRFGVKANAFIRVGGEECPVVVLKADGDDVMKTDDEYLCVSRAQGGVPLGAIFLGRLIGAHAETGSPLFEGQPAKLPAPSPHPGKRRRPGP